VVGAQLQSTFMPLGEALQYADGCRNEGRLPAALNSLRDALYELKTKTLQ
jgi:hypothetical protein